MNAYPDAKVILTNRDADSWYRSFKHTVYRLAVYLSSLNGDLPEYFQRWKEMNSTLMLDGALSDPELFNDEEAIKAKYNAHVEWVKKTVPSDRLFVMELGEGWERLCKFLDVPVPDEPYPNGNSTEDFIKEVVDTGLAQQIEESRKIDAQQAIGV